MVKIMFILISLISFQYSFSQTTLEDMLLSIGEGASGEIKGENKRF